MWGTAEHTVKADADGKWSSSFTATEIPKDGSSTISAVATDVAGNVSMAGTQTVTVDTVVSAAVITSVTRGTGKDNFHDYNDNYIDAWEKQALTVKGTAEAGTTLDVTLGDKTHSVAVQNDGTWTTNFAPNEVPADGATVLKAVVKDNAGNTATTQRNLTVDTVGPADATIDPITGDNLINATEKAAGLTVTGTAEANGYVMVFLPSLPGSPQTVAVDSTGHWSAHFTSDVVPSNTSAVWVTAFDAAVNPQSGSVYTEQKFTYDTEVAAPTINMVATDDKVNATEKTAGVNVNGTAEVGSSVKVVWGTAEHTVKADVDGKWSSTFAQADIPADGNTSISAVATDVAGNVSTAGTHAVKVDTVVPVPTIATVAGDDVVSAAEQAAGVTASGTAEADSKVDVVWDKVSHSVTAGTDGTWSTTFTSAEVPGNGAHAITATATDAAGNVSATQTHAVSVGLNPVLSSDVNGASNFDVRSDIVLKSSLAGHLADGTWTIKLVNDANDASHAGYRGEAKDNSQSLTFSVANGVITDLSGGHVSVSADGKSIVLNPTFDLDLGNKYHIETAAGMFQTAGGQVSDAFNGAHFATVNPGVYNATEANDGGVLAQKFDENGALVDSQRWVDITGNGRFTGSEVSISAGNGDYAFVVKDLSGDDPAAGNTLSGDGVSIDGDLNVLLTGFGQNDLLYIDQQDNSAPQNDMSASTFAAGDGHGVPLEYVGGAGGSAKDDRAQVHIQLESGLNVINSDLAQVVTDIHSTTGVVISG
ncbi:hypothetical protein A3218_05605 [Pseudomonas chlororaphis]|nr:hypothetical protein A3218_05605 [Pseudomonas chlororaphis]